jgi:hypothetical protein
MAIEIIDDYPLIIVIFYRYVSLPEGKTHDPSIQSFDPTKAPAFEVDRLGLHEILTISWRHHPQLARLAARPSRESPVVTEVDVGKH